MSEVTFQEKTIALSQSFITALAAQDFDHLEALFAPQVRFRALVPPRICEGKTAGEATDWLRRWFGGADEFQILESAADQVFDRLYLRYRLRLHDVINGWRVIEQQAYGGVQEGHIADIWLLCSGFRPDSENRERTGDASTQAPQFAEYHSAVREPPRSG
ncbi:MAG: nuclear transport factor 2 family protein [Ardenticatenaceae bacterium]|nr:nuclear transport factor 2 family protein [Ardenticatenaceae bacterium]HBY98037.1 hypothetical protein [Chloroflexota bacterium]